MTEEQTTEGTESMSKYIVYGLDGDPTFPCLNVMPNNADMGPMVLNVVGAGYPYYAFQTLPTAILMADELGANFNGAPLANTDYQVNRNTVAAQFANPVPTGANNDGTNMVWVVA